jgi:hypothetical protein
MKIITLCGMLELPIFPSQPDYFFIPVFKTISKYECKIIDFVKLKITGENITKLLEFIGMINIMETTPGDYKNKILWLESNMLQIGKVLTIEISKESRSIEDYEKEAKKHM